MTRRRSLYPISQGDTADALFYIQKGKIKLTGSKKGAKE